MGNRKRSRRRGNLHHAPEHYPVLVAPLCTSRFLTIALPPSKVNLADAPAERGAQLWRFMPKAWSLSVGDPDPRSIQRRAQQNVPLEQVYAQWPVSEDPDVHVQALQKLIDSGVTHIFIHSPQPDQARVISFYGEQVLPRLSTTPLAESRR